MVIATQNIVDISGTEDIDLREQILDECFNPRSYSVQEEAFVIETKSRTVQIAALTVGDHTTIVIQSKKHGENTIHAFWEDKHNLKELYDYLQRNEKRLKK